MSHSSKSNPDHKLWDQLVGQVFNTAKSSMWSSHQSGRKDLRRVFLEFPVELEIEVLGTKMYTSKRKGFGFDPGKLKGIISDINHIGALNIPCSV